MRNPLWRVEMFGRFSLSQGEHYIERFRTAKSGALLARLLCFPRVRQTREVLIDCLWPDADLTTGRNRLKQELATLRRILEPAGMLAGSVVLADRTVIALRTGTIVSDAGEFEMRLARVRHCHTREEQAEWLSQALTLYTGELLPGYYDEWIVSERERLVALYERAQWALDKLHAAGTRSTPVGAPPDDVVLLPVPNHAPTARPADAFAPLPLPFTRLWGRETETEQLCKALASPVADDTGAFVRLVTLTGPGGAGKTRLALAMARQLAPHYAGEIAFVPLADVSDPALIVGAVRESLCLAPEANAAALEQIAARLSQRPSLLALDNFEHLLHGGIEVIRALRERVPGLTLLVTSRLPLALEGEQIFPVGPLPVPQGDEALEELLRYASVQLFLERARATRPDFPLNARNTDAVVALCRDLDGLPLALELAASRANVLSAAQMHAQLTQRFHFLVSKRRDIASRHRSLRAALAWSYDLLPPDLRVFFCRLSVFRGGFTLDAAQQVCAPPVPSALPDRSAMFLENAPPNPNPAGIGDMDVLNALETLHTSSLLIAEEQNAGNGQEARYRLLETLREFGQECLMPEEADALHRRHRDYFFAFAQQADAQLRGADADFWLD